MISRGTVTTRAESEWLSGLHIIQTISAVFRFEWSVMEKDSVAEYYFQN